MSQNCNKLTRNFDWRQAPLKNVTIINKNNETIKLIEKVDKLDKLSATRIIALVCYLCKVEIQIIEIPYNDSEDHIVLKQ